ncbi:MAG TPA: hypothetical protein DCF68_05525 [Cyanothece sp. UBA12306]|nr:hypothetical protein [Cyanothece sp. UBA12306]
MARKTLLIFGKTKFIQDQIDQFMDKISQGSLCFERGIQAYLDNDCSAGVCEDKLQQLIKLKEEARQLKKAISTELYTEMLIPDARGDVLSLLQDLYYIIDICGDTFEDLLIIPISIPQTVKPGLKELITIVIKCIDTVITAARSYFREPITVKDYIHKISFYETEADQIGLRLKKQIFQVELRLSERLALAKAIDVIDEISDHGENVGDWLEIYAIKRAL